MTVKAVRAITLGHPSYVWRFGQERRLALIRRYVPLENKRILDIGCGIGTYVRRFGEFTNWAYGVDIEIDRVAEGSQRAPNLAVAVGERLPFKDESFDVIFLNEVLEHVADDAQTIREAHRVTAAGGHIVIYVPNRLYFFETHGFYLGRKYIFKLLPLVNWLPDPLRRVFVPHVRAYMAGGLKGLFRGLGMLEIVHTYVYPGFDNIVARRPLVGSALRKLFYFVENTPLRVFGLSHFLVMRKHGRSPQNQVQN